MLEEICIFTKLVRIDKFKKKSMFVSYLNNKCRLCKGFNGDCDDYTPLNEIENFLDEYDRLWKK